MPTSEPPRDRVLVVDDEAGMREMLLVLLRRAGYEAEAESSGKRAIERLERSPEYDLVITDLVMPGTDGMGVLAAVKSRSPGTQVIVITAHATTETAVDAMRGGAYDYVVKPFKVEEMRIVIERSLEKRRLLRENVALKRRVAGRFEVADIVGTSPAMRQVVELCKTLSPTRANVLISGESGTGKELVARSLHSLGPRAAAPFVVVNCGALPEALMESELFGHEKGAFTGAVRRSDGLFRQADGGTLFLDEVGELPLLLQVKLLRVIQERAVRSVGGEHEDRVDVRLVAASNRDLQVEVTEGRFRSDLYYRLNVVHISIPPLRERRDDIPILLDHFVVRHAAETGRPPPRFNPEAFAILLDHDYPGNVRELENVVERALALSPGEEIGIAALPPGIDASRGTADCGPTLPDAGIDLDSSVASYERALIVQALERADGVRTKAAELLGITFRSLRYRLRKLGLDSSERVGENGHR